MPINSTLDVVIQEDDLVVLGPPSTVDISLDIGAQGDPGSQIYTGAFDPNTLNSSQFASLFGTAPQGNDLFLRSDVGEYYGVFYSYVNVPGGEQWEPVLEIIDAINLFFQLDSSFILSASSGGTGIDNGSNTFTFNGDIEFSGPYSGTFNLQGDTNITLPTSGSVAVWQDKLDVFSPTTSAELASVITDETGTGNLVFNTSPDLSTSITTADSTFSLINTNATTVNFAGAATGLSIASNTGLTTINNDLLVSASHLATVDALQLDVTPGVSASIGRFIWDDGDGTAHITLKGGNVDLSIGQEEVALCYNGSGSAMSDGQVVYIAGAQGQRPDIRLASSSTESSSSKTFGVVTEPIGDEEEGFVATFGLVKGIDTEDFAEGAALWLSASAGLFTDVMPQSPEHAVFIGYVVKSHKSSGQIFVNIQNGYEIEELHNVLVTSASANDVLRYNAASSIWVNEDISTLLNYSPITFTSEVFGVSPTSSAAFTTKSYVDNAIGAGNLPSQTGNEGKYLSTSGSAAFWSELVIPESTVSEKTSSYTLQLADAQTIIEVNSASAQNITIPADSSVNFPVGSNIDIVQTGTGQVTIVPDSGVTLLSKESSDKLTGQYSAGTIYKKSSNTWVLIGDITN